MTGILHPDDNQTTGPHPNERPSRSEAEPQRAEGYKGYRDDSHRSIAPAETIARALPFLEHMGITRISNITGLDRIGIPVVMVCRPNSRSVAVSQGKGLSLDAAKASGIMEAIEGWHAERSSHPLILGSYEELAETYPLVDVGTLPAIEGSHFHPHLPILWIEGRLLGSDAAIWLPFEMVHTNYTVPRPTGAGCFPASTNGLASGNHHLEAVCHAICELIERDATCHWNYLTQSARSATRLDPASIDDRNCRDVLEKLHDAGLDVAIWNTTTDIGVASIYCLLMEDGKAPGHLGEGAGCHPSRNIALLRALTEAVQTRTTYIAGSRDDIGPEEFTPEAIEQKYRFAMSVLDGDEDPQDFRTIPTREEDNFEADLHWLVDRLASVGADRVIVVNLSKPGLDLAVVRAVIPGLEHNDESHAPGPRLQRAIEKIL